jgi:hypothetical protein
MGPLTPSEALEFNWFPTDWECLQPCYNPGSSLWVRATELGQVRCAGDDTKPVEGLGSCAWIDNVSCAGTVKPNINLTAHYTCRSYDQDWCGPARNQLEPHLYPGTVGSKPCPDVSTTQAPLPTCTATSTLAPTTRSTSVLRPTTTLSWGHKQTVGLLCFLVLLF